MIYYRKLKKLNTFKRSLRHIKSMLNSNVIEAAAILSQGGLVAFPTETVYGLGADAKNPDAIARVFAAKGRPKSHPLIVHVASWALVEEWARDIPKEAFLLAQSYWPGPLTLILKKQKHVLDILTGGQDTIGLRIPRHPIALELLHVFGDGIAAPSANQFTRISPTTALAVQQELGAHVDVILDGGECEVGLESTIVDLSSDKPRILRPGMILVTDLAQILEQPVVAISPESSSVRTAGMCELHYAPRTKTKLISSDQLTSLAVDNLPAVVIYCSNFVVPKQENVTYIRMPNDAKSYAHQLYQTLREADQANVELLLIECVPEGGEWEAIRDRLKKAAGGSRS
jgi:L-threonylcarbamoyladenylate synthase